MKVAVLGATGAVGRMMLRILEERRFPAEELVPLASAGSLGRALIWRGREYRVDVPTAAVFRGCRLALFSAGAERSREWAPIAAEQGALVVDNSSAWRLDAGVPLVVPEVNGARLSGISKGIVANPNCVTIQLVLALEALRRAAGLRRVIVSSYQSVSGAGQQGLEALRHELAGGTAEHSPFPAMIAGNVIPRIGKLSADGWTGEEEKIRDETRKILGLSDLAVAATCVRVPLEVGHATAVTVELEKHLELDAVRTAMLDMPGLRMHSSDDDPLPRQVAGQDLVHVGRLRADRDLPLVLHLWVVADNLRKGAAVNAVQIAERLIGV